MLQLGYLWYSISNETTVMQYIKQSTESSCVHSFLYISISPISDFVFLRTSSSTKLLSSQPTVLFANLVLPPKYYTLLTRLLKMKVLTIMFPRLKIFCPKSIAVKEVSNRDAFMIFDFRSCISTCRFLHSKRHSIEKMRRRINASRSRGPYQLP